MPCYHPLHGFRAKRVNASGKRGVTFIRSEGLVDMPLDIPCGQCIGCRLERSRVWAMRCMHEASLHKHSAFLTLTYSPENLPKDGTLVKKHFQDFMKRYRSMLDIECGTKIRFYMCGEYGEKTLRPHYHALIFGHEFSDKQYLCTRGGNKLYTSKMLDEKWGVGNCIIGDVTFESAAYVARYVTKKITGEKALDHYNVVDKETGEVLLERLPEYTDMSRRPGIGRAWFDRFSTDVFPHDEVFVRGKRCKPPRYYSNLYEKLEPGEMALIKRKRIAFAKLPEIAQHNSWERLAVRKTIQERSFQELKRNYEK